MQLVFIIFDIYISSCYNTFIKFIAKFQEKANDKINYLIRHLASEGGRFELTPIKYGSDFLATACFHLCKEEKVSFFLDLIDKEKKEVQLTAISNGKAISVKTFTLTVESYEKYNNIFSFES